MLPKYTRFSCSTNRLVLLVFNNIAKTFSLFCSMRSLMKWTRACCLDYCLFSQNARMLASERTLEVKSPGWKFCSWGQSIILPQLCRSSKITASAPDWHLSMNRIRPGLHDSLCIPNGAALTGGDIGDLPIEKHFNIMLMFFPCNAFQKHSPAAEGNGFQNLTENTFQSVI